MKYRFVAALAVALIVLSAVFSYGAPQDEFKTLVEKEGPKVREVLDSPTLYRVAQLDGLPCDSRTFEFLLDRPRTSMILARWVDPSLDAYNIEVRPDGSYHVDDHGRLVGDMVLVDGSEGKRVYYISGHWKFVFGITFEGRMVLVPEYAEHMGKDGPVVDASARGYMKIDNAVIGYMAKVVAYLFPGKVDSRIQRFAGAIKKVTQKVHDDPEGVLRKLSEPGGAPPEEVREFRARFIGAPQAGG